MMLTVHKRILTGMNATVYIYAIFVRVGFVVSIVRLSRERLVTFTKSVYHGSTVDEVAQVVLLECQTHTAPKPSRKNTPPCYISIPHGIGRPVGIILLSPFHVCHAMTATLVVRFLAGREKKMCTRSFGRDIASRIYFNDG